LEDLTLEELEELIENKKQISTRLHNKQMSIKILKHS